MSSHVQDLNNYEIIEEVRDAIYNKGCVLFVGSGLYAMAYTKKSLHPPRFVELLRGITNWSYEKKLIDLDNAKGIDELINDGYLIEAGLEIEDIFRQECNHGLLQLCLKELLPCDSVEISNLYKSLVKIPFKAYYSNYYDTLIEESFKKLNGIPLQKFDASSISKAQYEASKGNPFIIKIKGDVDNPRLINFGDRSSERFAEMDAEFRDNLLQLISVSSILFIGCERYDIEINSHFLGKVLSRKGMNPHWIVIPEGEIPKLKAKRLLEDRGIRAIYYTPDLEQSQLIKFLDNLAIPPKMPSYFGKKNLKVIPLDSRRNSIEYKTVQNRETLLGESSYIQTRVSQLKDNITKNLKLLKEYEDDLLYEDDPKKKAKYRKNIEELRSSAGRYQQEYDELEKRVLQVPSEDRQKIDRQFGEIRAMLVEIQAVHKAIVDELKDLRQTVLVRFDANEQAIIGAVVKELNQNQLAAVKTVLDAVEANRVAESESIETLNAMQQALSEIQEKAGQVDPKLVSAAASISKSLEDQELSTTHKLKYSVPLIPLILSYEGEVELKSGVNLKSAWQALKTNIRGS